MMHNLIAILAVVIAMYAVVGLIIGASMYRDYRRGKRDDKRVVEEIIRMCREGAE